MGGNDGVFRGWYEVGFCGGLNEGFYGSGSSPFFKTIGFSNFYFPPKKILGCSGPNKFWASLVYTNVLESHLPTISGTG